MHSLHEASSATFWREQTSKGIVPTKLGQPWKFKTAEVGWLVSVCLQITLLRMTLNLPKFESNPSSEGTVPLIRTVPMKDSSERLESTPSSVGMVPEKPVYPKDNISVTHYEH